jgi:hypothetical protein
MIFGLLVLVLLLIILIFPTEDQRWVAFLTIAIYLLLFR